MSAPEKRRRIEKKKNDIPEYKDVMSRLHVLGDGAVALSPSRIEGAGLGVFALKDFEPGDPITAYYGKIVPYKEARRLRTQGLATHLRSHIALTYALDGLYHPDGRRIESPLTEMQGHGIAAFVNHNEDPAKRNADFDFVDTGKQLESINKFLKGISRVESYPEDRVTFIKATRKIRAGEEVFVTYGEDYDYSWHSHNEDDDDEE